MVGKAHIRGCYQNTVQPEVGVDGSIKFWEHTPSKGLTYHIMIGLDQHKMMMGPYMLVR